MRMNTMTMEARRERAWDPLELELKVVVSCLMLVLGTELQFSQSNKYS